VAEVVFIINCGIGGKRKNPMRIQENCCSPVSAKFGGIYADPEAAASVPPSAAQMRTPGRQNAGHFGGFFCRSRK